MRTTVIAVLICFASVASAAEKGFFGFALRTEFGGSFWSPVLTNASIAQVVPGSATAKSGIAVGDVLLEYEGLAIPGAKGDDLKRLKAALDRSAVVGDQLRMKLRRGNGKEYSVVLTAEPRKQ